MHQTFLFRALVIAVAGIAVLGGTVAITGAAGATTPTAPAVTELDDRQSPRAQQSPQAQQQAAVQQQGGAQQRSPRADFLEIRAVDDGEYAYRLRVDGYVQRTRVDDRIKSEANDRLRRNDDGTVTVTGTTGNGLSDAYVIVGEIVAFRKTGGESDGELTMNGLALSVDELLNTETVEVISRDEDEEVRYEFRARGSVERIETEEAVAGDGEDRITRNGDGTVTVRGVAGDQTGDAFRVDGELLSFRRTGGDSRFRLRLDGLDVTPRSLDAGVGALPGNGGSGDTPTETDTPDDTDTPTDTETPTATPTDTPDDTDTPTDTATPSDTDTPTATPTDTPDDGDAADNVTSIGDCTRIDEPGEYVLTRDIDANGDSCIEIGAGGVTFDGDGHRVTGTDASDSVGIRVAAPDGEEISDVTVRNVDVRDWDAGVRATSRRGGSVSDVSIGRVTSVSNVGFGIHLADVDAGQVSDVTARENGATGVLLDEPGPESGIRNSRLAANGGYGVVVFDASHATVVRGNRVTNNDGTGIATSNGDRDTVIRANVVRGNGADGISLSDSQSATVRDNVVRGNDEAGLVGFDAREATVAGNEIRGNGAYGVELRYADGLTVRENEIRRNGDSGVVLARSSENEITRNVVCRNLAALQIRVGADSSGNEIRENRVSC